MFNESWVLGLHGIWITSLITSKEKKFLFFFAYFEMEFCFLFDFCCFSLSKSNFFVWHRYFRCNISQNDAIFGCWLRYDNEKKNRKGWSYSRDYILWKTDQNDKQNDKFTKFWHKKIEEKKQFFTKQRKSTTDFPKPTLHVLMHNEYLLLFYSCPLFFFFSLTLFPIHNMVHISKRKIEIIALCGWQ